jgi:hypothetical protein
MPVNKFVMQWLRKKLKKRKKENKFDLEKIAFPIAIKYKLHVS